MSTLNHIYCHVSSKFFSSKMPTLDYVLEMTIPIRCTPPWLEMLNCLGWVSSFTIDERPGPRNELIHAKRCCLQITIFTQRSETESVWLARKRPLWMPLPTPLNILWRENKEEEKHIYSDFCLVHSSEWLLNKIIKKRIGTQSISVLVSNKYVHSKLYKQDSKYKNAVECSLSIGNLSQGSIIGKTGF